MPSALARISASCDRDMRSLTVLAASLRLAGGFPFSSPHSRKEAFDV